MKNYTIKEIFSSIQGEGARSGVRSTFVRFSGCNLWNGRNDGRTIGKAACATWCDTFFDDGEILSLEKLLFRMEQVTMVHGERWCVLTGGEPALQVDRQFIEALHKVNWFIAMETNGTLDPQDAEGSVLDQIDHLCVSPKRGTKLVRFRAHELKVVLPGNGGGYTSWNISELEELRSLGQFDSCFVQPMDYDKQIENLQLCIQFVLSNPCWRLSIQAHKLANLP